MTLSKAMAKLRIRLQLKNKARSQYEKAQQELEAARSVDMHPREQLVNAAQEALAKLNLRGKQVDESKSVVKRIKATRPPKTDLTKITPNRSSRGGVAPRVIVLHITVSHNRPGKSDVQGILDFFANPTTQASSHLVIDSEGFVGRCVNDVDKAWTQAAFNPQALSIEQIEYADKPRARWLSENAEGLEVTARWVAWWSHKYDIPLKHSTSNGVCQHRDLGAAGGGHTDCGDGYPFDRVLKRAAEYRKSRYGH